MNREDVFEDSIDYPGKVLYNITVEHREGPLKFRLILEDIDYDYDYRVREFIPSSTDFIYETSRRICDMPGITSIAL